MEKAKKMNSRKCFSYRCPPVVISVARRRRRRKRIRPLPPLRLRLGVAAAMRIRLLFGLFDENGVKFWEGRRPEGGLEGVGGGRGGVGSSAGEGSQVAARRRRRRRRRRTLLLLRAPRVLSPRPRGWGRSGGGGGRRLLGKIRQVGK